jgi:hypothetical protein
LRTVSHNDLDLICPIDGAPNISIEPVHRISQATVLGQQVIIPNRFMVKHPIPQCANGPQTLQ